MTPHRIRLRGHWSTSPLGDGRTRHSRRFGKPRTLDPGESIWLTGSATPGPALVMLNDRPLGTAAGPFVFDVTSALLPRNEVALDARDDTTIGEVALEIRGPTP